MTLRNPRHARGAWGLRPRARRSDVHSFRPSVLALEPRLALSGAAAAPTDAEQYMLELINLARSNPAAMGQQLYNQAQTNPVLKAATQGWNLNTFLQEIDSFGPEPPLAFNTSLIQAATAHSQAMLAANGQFHSPGDFLTNPASGVNGQAYYPVGPYYWSTGENIFAYSANVGTNDLVTNANYFEAAFLLDWGNPDFGHLTNLLAPGPGEWSPGAAHYPYSEIGIGMLTGVTPTVPPSGSYPLNVGPDIVTQEFGWRSGNPILTGVFYNDAAGTGFYAPGEGYGGVTVSAVGLNGQGTFQTTTWSTGGYSLPLPPGTYAVTASGGNLPSSLSTTVTLHTDNVEWEYGFKPTRADQPLVGSFLGNGHDQVAVYRASTAQWFVAGESQPISFGGPGIDIPMPGDYDGVGHTELAVYRPSTSQWFVLGPKGGENLGAFGGPKVDIPLPGDFDGVGHTEPAVYRPSTAQWFVLGPKGGHLLATFGAPNRDIPVPGDYDGVGHDEPAVYRPSTGQWFVYGPNGGHLIATLGAPNLDIPVPGDYDGVGHDEPAVYRPTTGQWFILGPNGIRVVNLGASNLDVPLHGNFDGNGKSDPTVFLPTTAQWFIDYSTGGTSTLQFGLGGSSVPVTSWLSNYAQHPSAQVTQALVTPQAQANGGGRPRTVTTRQAQPSIALRPVGQAAVSVSGKRRITSFRTSTV